MGHIALLVPRSDMLQQAHNILQEMDISISYMKYIKTEEVIMEARNLLSEGRDIIIARGLQARLIEKYTDANVVPIVLTAQEMAVLLNRAKNISKKENPRIAVIGFRNMFCDISSFSEIFGIEIKEYYLDSGDELALKEIARRAMSENPDCIIGGDTVVRFAEERNIPSLFLATTEDAMRSAIINASVIEKAIDQKKQHSARIDAILDYSYNGIAWTDIEGNITSLNPILEEMSGINEKKLLGKSLKYLSPDISDQIIHKVLKEGKEYSLYLRWGETSVFAAFAPVIYEDKIDGAVLTCTKLQKAVDTGNKAESNGHVFSQAVRQFGDVIQKSQAMQECIRIARLFAFSDKPVVLTGESGTEKRILAECIHNAGKRARNPFLDVPCEGTTSIEQKESIFGEHGAFMQCPGGTVMIRTAENLTRSNQYRLYQAIYFKVIHRTESASLRKINVRVIVTLKKPLRSLWKEGVIQDDLYYLLSGLELRVPSLSERREDLDEKIDLSLRECNERYMRYHVLTNSAKAVLTNYKWTGNLFQIDSFMDRLVLTADKRSITDHDVEKLLNELYPEESLEISDLKERKEKNFKTTGFSTDFKVGDFKAGDFKANNLKINNLKAGDLNIYRKTVDLKNFNINSQGSGEEDAGQPGLTEKDLIMILLSRHMGNRNLTAMDLGISKSTLWRKIKKYNISVK